MTVQQQILKKVNILSTILVGNGKPENGIVFRLKELENAIERHFKKQKEKEESRYETNTVGEKVLKERRVVTTVLPPTLNESWWSKRKRYQKVLAILGATGLLKHEVIVYFAEEIWTMVRNIPT